jgi:hypothetical protein
MGLIVLAIGTACFFVLITQKFISLNQFDWIAFSLFASFGLLAASLTLVLMFLYRFNKKHTDFIAKPSILSGLARDVITLYETIFIVIFVFSMILFVMFIRNGQSLTTDKIPLMTKMIFSLWGDVTLLPDEKTKRAYILFATPFAMVLLALTSYQVYIANVLQYIQ